jgi:parvulin-like peptidyl-prolyl isomerase
VAAILSVVVVVPKSAAAEGPAPRGIEIVAATVGHEPIYAQEIEPLLRKVTGSRQVAPSALPLLKAQLLEEVVNRRLVLAYASREEGDSLRAEVDKALSELKSELAARRRTLDDYLRQHQVTKAQLRRQLAWTVIWPKYRARYVTDERVAAYFQAHRRELDGTQLAVSHILFETEPGAGPDDRTQLMEKARGVHRAILAGETTFADAARKHSAAPSAAEGGRVGLIGRHGPMVEPFSRAAFALEVGQTSEPVETFFGIHLIRCEAIQPGSKKLTDVRAQVEVALARELIERIAQFERSRTPVEYSGNAPYLEPKTRQLIVP